MAPVSAQVSGSYYQSQEGFKMKKSRLIQTVLLSVLMSLLMKHAVADGSSALQPKLSSAQAIGIANVVCRRVGIIPAQPGVAEFPVTKDSIEETYWQSRWHVSFPGQAVVEVVDQTGLISRFENTAYLSKHDYSPAGQAIPQEEAVRLATQAVNATGLLSGIKFWRASLLQLSRPPLATTNEWEVLWQRAAGDIPYRHQHVAVGLDAQTGELKNLVVMFPSPPISIARVAITQQQAAGVSHQQLLRQGFSEKPLQSAELEIVRVGTEPVDANGHKLQTGVARVVWSCLFQDSSNADNVWVDAETGQIIGGESYERAGLHMAEPALQRPQAEYLNPVPLHQAIRSATAVSVYGQHRVSGTRLGWDAKPLAVLGDNSHADLFHFLKATKHFGEFGIKAMPKYIFVFVVPNRPPQGYMYNGYLGSMNALGESASLPDALTTWLKQHPYLPPIDPQK